MNTRLTFLLPVFAIVVLWSTPSSAFTFTPTDTEWHSWPGYCKAKYAWTNIGRGSRFARLVTAADKAELAHWEKAGISGVHHYCAGSAWLQRSRLESDDSRRKYMLRQAENETLFTVERSNKYAPEFVYLAIQMATIMNERGNTAAAVALLESVIVGQPTNDVIYSAAAIMQRKLGNLEEAKATLLQGHEALEGRSAEICYNLGLISLELGDVDAAEKYAQLAYQLGYPLPGLRAKLVKLGRLKD
jgi:Flp pilus assembly protein TadD